MNDYIIPTSSWNMGPALPGADFIGGWSTNPKSLSELGIGKACVPHGSHFNNLGFGKLRVFLVRSTNDAISLLGKHIASIFGGSSKEKMVRVYADRIVAFVTNTDTLPAHLGPLGVRARRDGSIVNCPRNTMRRHALLLEYELAMSIVKNGSNPRPAVGLRLLGNFAPKTREECWIFN